MKLSSPPISLIHMQGDMQGDMQATERKTDLLCQVLHVLSDHNRHYQRSCMLNASLSRPVLRLFCYVLVGCTYSLQITALHGL